MWFIPFPKRYRLKKYFFRQIIDSFLYTVSLITTEYNPRNNKTGMIDNINIDIVMNNNTKTLIDAIKEKETKLKKFMIVFPTIKNLQ